jgi:acyl-CoA synthetase (AMP-forming)/AMP-acid ligase II
MPVNVDIETYNNAMVKNKIPSVGIALEGNDVEILVNNNHLTANEEEEGEIVIRGENVFGGYYQDLGDDLFWNKYFKTGDLGYFKMINSKKYFFISGRIKEVAKINSESISLRWVDEYWAKLISIPYDFYSTSFYNEASGELLAAIVKLDLDDFENQDVFDFIVKSFDKIKGSYRPSVLIIGGKSIQIRTPSGKAKRWKYKEMLKQFSTYRKSKAIEIIKLEKE